jgi:hypothetical protein
LCLSRSNATIKQHISTPVVHSLIVVASKHVLVSHCAYSFVVNVQPSFPAITASVRVEHVDTIVPIACGPAVMVKHPIKLVEHQLRGFPGNGCHHFYKEFLSPG